MVTGSPAVRGSAAVDGGPRGPLIWALGLAGCVAAASSFVYALESEVVSGELGEPFVVAFLVNWNTAAYVLCGLLAWSRRPESRFGLLLVAAGFANFLSTLSWTTSSVLYTFGQALDFLPPILFLHVFLAFPTGRLETRLERGIVVTGYTAAISLELLRMVQLDPDRVYSSYPHQLSGGMKQRVCIATAISLRPKVIIADDHPVVRQGLRQMLAVEQDVLQMEVARKLVYGRDRCGAAHRRLSKGAAGGNQQGGQGRDEATLHMIIVLCAFPRGLRSAPAPETELCWPPRQAPFPRENTGRPSQPQRMDRWPRSQREWRKVFRQSSRLRSALS